MPELPEVQTVVNSLAEQIIGKVFKTAEIKVPKMVNKNFKYNLKNLKVKKVYRRAKMIIIELFSGQSIMAHLKMTGQLIYTDKKGRSFGGGHPIESTETDLSKPNKFTRIILKFTDGGQLLFHDVRKFGWMKLVSQKEINQIIGKFGIEPLTNEFSLKKFLTILSLRPNSKIKQVLMNQELIAGIGNIYADESLFAAKISPWRPVKTLTTPEIKKLRQSIIKILRQAVKLGGTSVNTFVDAFGKRGNYAARLKVYGRGGEKCFKCMSVLSKTKLSGRGTVYCPKCQK